MFGKKYNRFRLLLIIEAVLAFALLLLCFRKEERVYSCFGEDISGLAVETDGYWEVSGEQMELTPGVYQVRIQTRLTEEQILFVQMKAEHSYFKALRNSGMAVFPGNDEAQFNVYVLDKTDTAYLYLRFSDADTSGLVSLAVYRTSMGSRMLLFIALLFFAALDFMIVFRRRILEGRVTGKQQIVFWTLTAGVAIAFFPYFTDYISWGADTNYHLSRIAYLKDALLQGQGFPVRMQGTWLYGHGYATSLFYGDLFLYFPALLMLLGFSVMSAYKMFVFAVLAATAVISYHCFYKCVRDEYAALFGSVMYILAPYHIFNIYNRGAVGEYLAMTFLPLVCCGMYLLYTEDVNSSDYRKHKWYIIWGMSAILQSHLITTEMTAVLMALVCVLFWRKTFRKQTIIQLLESVGIVLLINMWFWLPMLHMLGIDSYELEAITREPGQDRGILFAGIFQLLPNRGSAQTGMWNCEPIQIGAGALLLLLMYLLWRLKGHKTAKGCTLFAVLSVLTVMLSTKYFPWDAIMKIPLLGNIVASLQFPSRWMLSATMCTALFVVFFLVEIREKGGTALRILTGISALIIVLSAVYHVNDYAYQTAPVFLYNVENMGTVGVVNGEYLLAGTDIFEMSYHKPVAEEGLNWRNYEKEGTIVTISLENTADEPLYLELPLMGYKGYGIEELESSGTSVPTISEERGSHGDLRLAVPAGYQGTIRVSWKGFGLYHVADFVSAVSIVTIIGVWVYRRKKGV